MAPRIIDVFSRNIVQFLSSIFISSSLIVFVLLVDRIRNNLMNLEWKRSHRNIDER